MGGSLASQSDGASAVVQALAGAALVTLIVAASSAILAEQGRMLDSYVELSELASLRALEKLSVELAPGSVRVRNEGAVGVKIAYVLAKTESGVTVSSVGVPLVPGGETEVAVPDQAENVIVVTARGNAFAAALTSEARTYGSSWIFGSAAGATVRLFANPWNLTYIYVVEGEGTVIHVLNGTTLEVIDSFFPPAGFERYVQLQSSGREVHIGVDRVVPSLDHRYAYLMSTDGAVACYDLALKDYVAAWDSPNPIRSEWFTLTSATGTRTQPFDAGTEVLYAATVGPRLIVAVHVYDPYSTTIPGTSYLTVGYHHYYRVYAYGPDGAQKLVLGATKPFVSFAWISGTEARAATADKKFAVVTDGGQEIYSYGTPASGSFDFEVVDAYYRRWRVAWVEGGKARCYEFRANYTDLPWWGHSSTYSYWVFRPNWLVITYDGSNAWEDAVLWTGSDFVPSWLVQSFTVPSSISGWRISFVDAPLRKGRNPTYGAMSIYTLRRELINNVYWRYYLDQELENTTSYTTYYDPQLGVTWVRFYFSNSTALSQTDWDSYAIVWKPDHGSGTYSWDNDWYRSYDPNAVGANPYPGGKAYEVPVGGTRLQNPDAGGGTDNDFWITIHLVNEFNRTATLTVQVAPSGSFGYAEVGASGSATANYKLRERIERFRIEVTFPSYLPLLTYSSSFSASGTVSESIVAVNSTHTQYIATWTGSIPPGGQISASARITQGWPPVSKSYGSSVKAAFILGDRLAAITAVAAQIYNVTNDALLASAQLNGNFPAAFQPTGYDFAYSSAGFYLCEQGYIELFDWRCSKLLTVGAADYRLYREHVPAAAVSERAEVAYVLSYVGTGVRVYKAESAA